MARWGRVGKVVAVVVRCLLIAKHETSAEAKDHDVKLKTNSSA
jgi:hypothetical protein